MIWFLLAAGVLTAAVLAVLLRPLLLRPRGGGGRQGVDGAAEPAAALYRRQLAAIDAEAAEGRLAPDEAEAARGEVTRRLLASAANRPVADAAEDGAGEASWRYAAAVAIAGLLPAAALAVYFAVGAPAAIDRGDPTEAAAPHGSAELAAAADKIKAHLETTPGDLKGWTLLGRTLASLGRFPEARDAYRHAIALAPGDTALHAELGEVLVLAAQGTVTQEATAEFARAPNDPRARYYAAEAALQRGDPAAAKAKLQALLTSAPADASWRQSVAERLAELSANTAPANAAPAAGPSAQDVAAAQSLTPEQRQAMIRGMVDRLARRLQQHPDDKPGWERLAHAYDVLGEKDKAAAARASAVGASPTAPSPAGPAAASAAPAAEPPVSRPPPGDAQGWIDRARALEGEGKTADALAALKAANTALPGNPALLEAYMKALAAGLSDGKPTPELAALAAQLNALDTKQPDALWYLGLAAAENGDHYRAAAYWTKLLGELPSGDTRRAVVEHRLAALR